MLQPRNDGPLNAASEHVLEVRNLSKTFELSRAGRRRTASVLKDVSLTISPGQTLGVVGESGSGKSTLARCVARVLQPTSGSIRLDGVEISTLSGRQLRRSRPLVQMIFQDSQSSLDPRMSIRSAIAEPLRSLSSLSREGRQARVSELMDAVGLAPALADRYTHQLSGGQLQRVGIARALALHPKLLIADEPVSALDVSIQASIMSLLARLQAELGFAILFISHDLAVVEALADTVAVMYLGEIVETSETSGLFASPKHPYTQSLLSASPVPDPVVQRSRSRIVLEGELPGTLSRPSGCSFHPRCPAAEAICTTTVPSLIPVVGGRDARCHLVLEDGRAPKLWQGGNSAL